MTTKKRCLLMNKYPEHMQKFTWNPEWISPYESPWSIFEKFKYANRATVMDLFDLFGNSYSKGLKHISRKASNLITLEGLDESLLKRTFGLSVKEVNRCNMDMLANILPEGSTQLYFYNTLRLCPDCIKIGYHSIFHQFSLIQRCPFHNVPLIEGCPKCERKLHYKLSDTNTKEPFQCRCGHLLFSLKKEQRYPSAWEKMNLPIQSKPLKYWITFNLENIHDKISLYFDSGIVLPKKKEGIMEFILEAILPSYKTNQSELHRKIRSSPFIRSLRQEEQKKLSPLTDEHYEIQLKKEIYDSSRSTLRSIVSHIKKVFSEHSGCIKEFIDVNFYNKPYNPRKNCPYAFAFVFWRYFNEGDKSIYDVNRGRRDIPLSNSLEYYFGTKQDHDYLNNLLYWIQTYCQIDNLVAMKWILNHVMSHLSLNHLRNWLRIASLYGQNNIKFHTVPFKFEHLPFYLIIIPKNKNEPIEFHWWSRKDTLQFNNLSQANLI